jgi:hypothetical protein
MNTIAAKQVRSAMARPTAYKREGAQQRDLPMRAVTTTWTTRRYILSHCAAPATCRTCRHS